MVSLLRGLFSRLYIAGTPAFMLFAFYCHRFKQVAIDKSLFNFL